MVNVLYEPTSIRSDLGILQLTEGEPCNIPFMFDIQYKDSSDNSIVYNITESDVVEFTIKSNIKLITPLINKKYNKIKNNVAVLSLSAEDMKLLLGGKTYVLSAKLYYSQGNKKKVLIKQLEVLIKELKVHIQEVV